MKLTNIAPMAPGSSSCTLSMAMFLNSWNFSSVKYSIIIVFIKGTMVLTTSMP